MELKRYCYLLAAGLSFFTRDSFAQECANFPGDKKVLMLGDSLCEGLRPHMKKLFVEAGYEFSSHCISGSTTTQWMSLAKKDIEKSNPDLILVSLGTNDSGSHYQKIKENEQIYKNFVSILQSTQSKWAWIGPPKLNEKKLKNAKEVRKKISDASEKFYFDSSKISFQQSDDGIHATVFGYNRWSEFLFDWLVFSCLVDEPYRKEFYEE